jgi:hypothetical protein
MIEMYDKRRECRYIPMGTSVEREIRAIKEFQRLNELEYKDRIILSFDENIFKSLHKILIKITKPS